MYLRNDHGLGDGWSRPCPPDVMTDQEARDVELLIKRMMDRHCGLSLSSLTVNCLTNIGFYRRHPELVQKDGAWTPLPKFKDATPTQKLMIYEWRDIKTCLVIPALKVFLREEKKEKKEKQAK